MPSSARMLRRLATIGAGALTALALAAPPAAHAQTTTTVPLPPSANCVSSLGDNIFCYEAEGYVSITDYADGSYSAEVHVEFRCPDPTAAVGCQPIDETVPIPRGGVDAGSPNPMFFTVLTVPHNVVCVNANCVPGFPIPLTAPTVAGNIATLWVAGTAIPVEGPGDPSDEVAGIIGLVPSADEVIELAEDAADFVIDTAEEQARKHNVIISINRPDL